MSEALTRVLAAVGEHKRVGQRYMCHCPAHEDRKPSLTVTLADDGKILIGCWAGCDKGEILRQLGLRWADLFPGNAGGAPTPLPKRRNKARPVLPKAKVPESNLKALQRGFAAALHANQLRGLAWKLGVTSHSLVALEIGWISALELERHGNARREAAYTFPERNGRGQLVGFSLRWQDGAKGFLHGTNRGLCIPLGLHRMGASAPVIAVEGASDVAALLSMNLPAVGRPSNTGGVEHLAYYCRDLHVMVMGENDEKPRVAWPPEKEERRRQLEALYEKRKRLGLPTRLGDAEWPGRDAAAEVSVNLARYWKRPVTWLLPPEGSKDVRAWLRSVVVVERETQRKQPDLAELGQRLLYESSWHVAGNEDAAKRMEALRRRKVMR